MSELALIYPRPSHIIDFSSSGLSSTPKDEVDPEVLEADNTVSSTEAKSPAQVEVYDPHDEICMDMEFSPLTPVFPEFVPRSPEKPQCDSSPALPFLSPFNTVLHSYTVFLATPLFGVLPCPDLYIGLHDLREYLHINKEGFRKIIKKHDKVCGGPGVV